MGNQVRWTVLKHFGTVGRIVHRAGTRIPGNVPVDLILQAFALVMPATSRHFIRMIALSKTGSCRAIARFGLVGIAACFAILTAAGLRGAVSGAQTTPIDEPTFAEIPKASGYLTEGLAAGWLRAEVQASSANEHIPAFWSQCVYSGKGVKDRQTGFVFKFMVWDLFDVKKLDPMQLDFHAGFASGGEPPLEKLKDLGKISFVLEKRNRTTLLVITGIQGPPDGARRPTELVASYYLSDPETSHEVRLEKLVAEARRELNEWLALGGADTPVP